MASFDSPPSPQYGAGTPTTEVGVRLAHRLRTPLATVKSAAQLVQRLKMDAEEAEPYLASIVQAVDRMSGCIEHFEQLLRIDVPADARCRIQPAANEAVAKLAETLAHYGASATISAPPETTAPMPHLVLVDTIAELVGNAAVHGGDDVAINLSWTPAGAGGCRVHVEDSGSGVPDDIADRILQPYFTTVDHRVGLGLTRVALVCQMAGGSLTWDERPEGGCRFVLVFPGGSDGPVPHRRG